MHFFFVMVVTSAMSERRTKCCSLDGNKKGIEHPFASQLTKLQAKCQANRQSGACFEPLSTLHRPTSASVTSTYQGTHVIFIVTGNATVIQVRKYLLPGATYLAFPTALTTKETYSWFYSRYRHAVSQTGGFLVTTLAKKHLACACGQMIDSCEECPKLSLPARVTKTVSIWPICIALYPGFQSSEIESLTCFVTDISCSPFASSF